MNYLWGGMILIGICYGALSGTMQEVSDAALSSSKEAITLCITMAGVMGFWVGLMKIAQESGLVAGLTKRLAPFISFMFPNIPGDHPAREHISMNVIANILGLGWAATPAGLKAMESLETLEEERRCAQEDRVQETRGKDQSQEKHGRRGKQARMRGAMPRGVASNEMCTFLILNISSLQLIPVNIIAYRSQYGSVNPTAVVGPAIAATAVSTAAAIIFCKMMEWRRRA